MVVVIRPCLTVAAHLTQRLLRIPAGVSMAQKHVSVHVPDDNSTGI